MTMYLPNIPTGNVPLDEDYLNLQHNFQQLDITYGRDHYAYSNATGNNGFHNTVTTPLIVGGNHPATAPAVPKFYGMQESANVGVIQFSRKGNNSVPSPVTHLQSQAAPIVLAPNGTTNILDFNGLARAVVKIVAANLSAPTNVSEGTIWWTGAAFLGLPINQNLRVEDNGSILRLRNNTNPGVAMNDVYWTLQLLRLS